MINTIIECILHNLSCSCVWLCFSVQFQFDGQIFIMFSCLNFALQFLLQAWRVLFHWMHFWLKQLIAICSFV